MAYGLPWTPNEDKILCENYSSLGVKVSEILPGRTAGACVTRARYFGLQAPREVRKPWTLEEDRVLRENYPIIGPAGCVELLPGRNFAACKNRARKFGIKILNYGWTPEEDRILIENFSTLGERVSELLPFKSATSCRNRAKILGVRGLREPGEAWTQEEDKILIENYGRLGTKVRNLLTGRTEASIRKRVQKLGLIAQCASAIGHREDVQASTELSDGWVALRCRECGRTYIMAASNAMKFSHSMCSTLKSVPSSWAGGVEEMLHRAEKQRERSQHRERAGEIMLYVT